MTVHVFRIARNISPYPTEGYNTSNLSNRHNYSLTTILGYYPTTTTMPSPLNETICSWHRSRQMKTYDRFIFHLPTNYVGRRCRFKLKYISSNTCNLSSVHIKCPLFENSQNVYSIVDVMPSYTGANPTSIQYSSTDLSLIDQNYSIQRNSTFVHYIDSYRGFTSSSDVGAHTMIANHKVYNFNLGYYDITSTQFPISICFHNLLNRFQLGLNTLDIAFEII